VRDRHEALQRAAFAYPPVSAAFARLSERCR
jgi:hypothetical protein